MADNKKSFVLYVDQIHTFEELTDEEAGKLVKHLYRYVNDLSPDPPDKLTKIVFEPIKQQLRRDLKKWENERGNRSKSGKIGGVKSGEVRRRKSKQSEANEAPASKTKQVEAKSSKSKQTQANEAVNVNVNVNDNVSERANTERTHDLKNSNLFRKPTIPTKQKVWEIFSGAGGTVEMAKSFYEKHEATGWYINGSPVVNVPSLAQRFISTWKSIEGKEQSTQSTSPPLRQAPDV